MSIVLPLFLAAAAATAAAAPGPLVSEATTLAEGGSFTEIPPLLDRAPDDPGAFLDAVIGIHTVLFDRERRAEASDLMKRAGARDPDLSTHLASRVRALVDARDRVARDAALAAYLDAGDRIQNVREILGEVFPRQKGRKSAEEAFPASAGMTAPKLSHKVEPVFPADLRRAHRSGVVNVFAFVSKTGTLRDAFVYKTTDSRFNDAALEAVRQWRYAPATLHGAPMTVAFTITVTFTVF